MISARASIATSPERVIADGDVAGFRLNSLVE
jgi:hypothetical protein